MKLFKQILCLLLSLSLLVSTPIGIMAEDEENIVVCPNCGNEVEYEEGEADDGEFVCPECGEENEEQGESENADEAFSEINTETVDTADTLSVAGKPVPDTSFGLSWLKDQTQVEKIVEENQTEAPKAKDVYDLVKNASVMYIGKNRGYIWGLELFVDSDDETATPFLENGITYAPFKFLTDSLTASVSWENDKKTVIIVSGDKTLEIMIGSTAALINGKEQTLAAPPIVKDGKTYLPVRAITEILGKNLYYKDGLIVIGSKSVIDAITEDQIDYLLTEDMKLEREKALHPYSATALRMSMKSADRTAINRSGEALEEQISPYTDISYYDLALKVNEKMSAYSNVVMNPQPEQEIVAAQLSKKYLQTGDEELALRAIIIMYHTSLAYYGNGLSRDLTGIKGIQVASYLMPAPLIYAYDQLYHSPMWEVFNKQYKTDAKKVIADCFLELYDIYRSDHFLTDKPEGNYPARLSASAAIAVALDRPDIAREVFKVIDNSLNDSNFYADGMWYEGSVSYGAQATGNFKQVVQVLTNYVDPIDYKDSASNEIFTGYVDYDKRWPIIYGMSSASKKFFYPDGSRVHINDTNYNTLAKTADDPIDPAQLESNIEMNHFGFYGLKYGDSEEAQQINLQIPATSSVSHQHASFLGLSYYSAGMELLPDIGYVRRSDTYRTTLVDILAHNMAFTNAEITSGRSIGSKFARPNVYVYDDGSTNGKQVQVVEGSNLFSTDMGVEMNRRMLMMIATDKNHSYAVDIQRIKGNTLHESFLQQVQEEDVEFETNLTLEPVDDGTTYDYLRGKGLYDNGLSGKTLLTSPQGKKTSEDFWFTYKGKTSGSTLKAYIKGDEGKVIAFSTIPTARRANNNAAKRDDFPGYHFYQGLNVNTKDTTVFGAVYEGYRKDEAAKVTNVTWHDPEDGNDETAMLEVELKDFIDYIYISNDTNPRKIGDFTFSTDAVAAVRVSKISGRVIWEYIYGEGYIRSENYELIGKNNQSYQVLDTQGSRTGEIPNQIKVQGIPTEDIAGLWGTVNFSDGSGTAFKVKDINQSIITVNNWPAFSVSEKGAAFLSYPQYEDKEKGIVSDWGVAYNYYDENAQYRVREGNVTFTIKRPAFFKARACDIYYK